MFKKMNLFNIEVGYTYRCSIRIDHNKNGKKVKIDITSRRFVSFNIVTLN